MQGPIFHNHHNCTLMVCNAVITACFGVGFMVLLRLWSHSSVSGLGMLVWPMAPRTTSLPCHNFEQGCKYTYGMYNKEGYSSYPHWYGGHLEDQLAQ